MTPCALCGQASGERSGVESHPRIVLGYPSARKWTTRQASMSEVVFDVEFDR